jgi:glucose-6-phosphate 1-dehydrogenase
MAMRTVMELAGVPERIKEGEKEYASLSQCQMEIPAPFCLVIFGASGDLSRRKILPALYKLESDKLFPDDYVILGIARTEMDNSGFRDLMKEAVKGAFSEIEADTWDKIAERLFYMRVDYGDQESFTRLKKELEEIEQRHNTRGNRIFYLALPPAAYGPVISNIGAAGLSLEERGYSHIVIEKPFGRDSDSSKQLNSILKNVFTEKQIYRMDHYLAKETVQNILIFRFANSIFEPLWNRRYIDHVQITVSETLGVEHRAEYYEKAGVLRDMFQNHIFQLLALTAMEPPSVFEAERVCDEKLKVLRSIRPFPSDRPDEVAVIGQYGSGKIKGEQVSSYREEEGVSPASAMPTFAALKVMIDNWRWNGVPFYLRSGKRLAKKKAEISIHYKPVPHLMFSRALKESIEPNTLVIRIQPDEGISLNFQTKTPGTRLCLNPAPMDFSYQRVFALDDYERVLLDCMQGDRMLFLRSDEVEETWSLLTPLIERLESEGHQKNFPNYDAGTSGPEATASLPERDGRSWRPI